MWSEWVTAVWVSACVGVFVYQWAYQRGQDNIMEAVRKAASEQAAEQEVERAHRDGGVVDPRGRVPLLGWVAVVAGTRSAQADAETGHVEAESVEGGGAAADQPTVTSEQVAELETWWAKQQREAENE